MSLDELEVAKARRYFIDSSGINEKKNFKYCQPFGLHFSNRHQVDGHNNQRHAPIYLERTWATRLWHDHNF